METLNEIIVEKPLEFSACQLAQHVGRDREQISGVYIEPSGRVTGTNGSILVTCGNVVEPFNGKAFILKAKPLLSQQARRCIVVIKFFNAKVEMLECRLPATLRVKSSVQSLVPAVVIDGKFPDYQDILPEFSDNDAGVNAISFDLTYLGKIATRIDPFNSSVNLKMTSSSSIMEIMFVNHSDIRVVMMPLRQ